MTEPSTGGAAPAAPTPEVVEARPPALRNGTPDRLRIRLPGGGVLVFAPLQERAVPSAVYPQLQELIDQDLLLPVQPRAERRYEWLVTAAFQAFFLGVVAVAWISSQTGWSAWAVGTAMAGVAAVAVVVGMLVTWLGGAAVARHSAQLAMLFLVVAIGVGLPLVTAWRFGYEDLLEGTTLAELTRFLQVSFISLACVVPGLLFFLFDRQRLSTLRARFEQQIFRLDPGVTTLADVQARYGKQIDETYGQPRRSASSRLGRQGRWPIPVATSALALGWIVVLLPAGYVAPLAAPAEVWRHFAPQPNAVTFAFLGAYFFAINLVLRRYAQDDLRPKAYSTITVRVLVAVPLGWMIDVLLAQLGPTRLVVAFFVGIVPETFLTVVREVYRTRLITLLTRRVEESVPLQDLEGLDLYDRARLLDEGIANVEALAHHDLVDLLLETRIPTARLIDWIDQAILYLHTTTPGPTARTATPVPEPAALRAGLRTLGVRTATDLETVLADHPDATVETLGRALGTTAAQSRQVLDVLTACFRNDEWLDQIRYWRRGDRTAERTIQITADGSTAAQPSTNGVITSDALTAGSARSVLA